MKKNPGFLCQDTQTGVKRAEKWFRKNVLMDVCACMRVCVRVLRLRKIQTSVYISEITQPIELKFGMDVKKCPFFSRISAEIK